MVTNFRIFISHSWAYGDAYDKLTSLLTSRPYFTYTDYSVPKNDPIHNCGSDAQLYAAIKNKIQLCNVVLIMAGVYSTHSKWINKEIDISKKEFSFQKPIIAVRPWAQTNVSTVVQSVATEIVSWNTDSIVNAIRKHAI